MRISRTTPWAAAAAAAALFLVPATATAGQRTAAPHAAPAPAAAATTVDAYYAAAEGKTGAALKTALHDIIKNQSKVTYDGVWNALKVTDQDPANPDNVILVYSGRSQSKSSNGGGVNDWNREHVWAKSHGDFGTATGPGTDLHHLRPEDVTVNSTRGNKDFDMGGSPVAEAPAATPTPTPSSRGTRSRATSRGCCCTWRCATTAVTASPTWRSTTRSTTARRPR